MPTPTTPWGRKRERGAQWTWTIDDGEEEESWGCPAAWRTPWFGKSLGYESRAFGGWFEIRLGLCPFDGFTKHGRLRWRGWSFSWHEATHDGPGIPALARSWCHAHGWGWCLGWWWIDVARLFLFDIARRVVNGFLVVQMKSTAFVLDPTWRRSISTVSGESEDCLVHAQGPIVWSAASRWIMSGTQMQCLLV